MVHKHSTPTSLQQTLGHYRTPLVVVAIGIALSIGGFVLALNSQTNVLKKDFLSFTKQEATLVDDRIHLYREKVQGVRALFETNAKVSEPELQRFVAPMLERLNFEMIGWLPEPSYGGSALFLSSHPVPVKRPSDIMSEPAIRDAIREETRSHAFVISLPFTRTQGKNTHQYVALLEPLIRNGQLQGTVAGVIDLQRLFESSPEQRPGMITVYLFDLADAPPVYVVGARPHKRERLPSNLAEATKGTAFYYGQPLHDSGDQWQLVFVPTPQYLLGALGLWPWMVLGGSLLITGLVGFATFQQARQGQVVSMQVEQQTRQLQAAHKYLEDMLNHIPDPIFMKDRQHRWIGGNKAFWELMSGPPEKFLGKSDYEFFPKEEADVFWKKDDQVFNSGEVDINEEFFTDAKGQRHIFLTKKIAFLDDHGEQFLLGIINDVTAAREAEQKTALLAAIVESSDDAIISKSLDDVIMSWNRGAEQLFGYAADEAIGQHNRFIIPPEKLAEDEHILTQMRAGETVSHYETVRVRKNGKRIDVSLTISPIRDVRGKVIGISKIAHDITDRKEAEVKLLRYMEELKRSNQELDDFAYIASHDLKEPLRGLFNHASFLLEDYQDKLNSDGVHRLQRLSYLCQRMEHLVNDLLYFSRLGRTEMAIQETDINQIINEIGQMMESFLKERNGSIIIKETLPRIVCDKPRITEVFRNLITNAVKYNDKAEQKVEVGYLQEVSTPQGVERDVFYVKDNGIGIAPEFHEEIFRIFRRLQSTTEDKESGTGVGLTFVKKIIERHKGRIWLESVPGKGSTFYFTVRRTDV